MIAVVVPSLRAVDGAALAFLSKERIGLWYLEQENIKQALPPHDLTMKVELPDLAHRSPKVRQLLSPVFDKFQHRDWKDAFTDACFELEALARKHMKDGIKSTRITVLDKKGQPVNFTNRKIDKLTLGQLAFHFENIQAPNAEDHALSHALTQVNKDRVDQIHHKKKKVTDNHLRKNVGKLMWLITDVVEKVVATT